MQDCFCEANGKDTSIIDRKNKHKRLLTQQEKLKSEVTYTFSYHKTRYPSDKNCTLFSWILILQKQQVILHREKGYSMSATYSMSVCYIITFYSNVLENMQKHVFWDSIRLQVLESLQIDIVMVPCVTHHIQADGQILDMVLPPEDFYLDYPLQLDHSYRRKTCKTWLFKAFYPKKLAAYIMLIQLQQANYVYFQQKFYKFVHIKSEKSWSSSHNSMNLLRMKVFFVFCFKYYSFI